MKTRLLFLSVLITALPMSMAAQDDDLYFKPKKRSKTEMSTHFDKTYTTDLPITVAATVTLTSITVVASSRVTIKR